MEFEDNITKLEYDESNSPPDESWELVYEQATRKVENQIAISKRIENKARKNERNTFMIFGLLLTTLSFTLPMVISGEVNLITTADDRLATLAFSFMDTPIPVSYGFTIVLLTMMFIPIYIVIITTHLFIISMYFNMVASRTSLINNTILSSSIHDMTHDIPETETLKKCILVEYSDIIAMNDMVISEKKRYKESGDDSTKVGLWTLLLGMFLIYSLVITIDPFTTFFSFVIVICDSLYRIGKVSKFLDQSYAPTLPGEIISVFNSHTFS